MVTFLNNDLPILIDFCKEVREVPMQNEGKWGQALTWDRSLMIF